ncbi:MAG TPA: hypothetical protein VG432_04545 [Gemmatimonadaceae bacterium]|nr:hypothetical protein [Gemmatimonadaceae bacterium]
MPLTRAARFLVAAALAAGSGCAEDPNVPPAGVPGTYDATTFTLASGGPAVNLLASGASLVMTLGADHRTTGALFIPSSVTGGEAIAESLAGTWRQGNDTVYFDQPADTFVRDVPFVVRGASLVGSYATPGGLLSVTLTKHGRY